MIERILACLAALSVLCAAAGCGRDVAGTDPSTDAPTEIGETAPAEQVEQEGQEEQVEQTRTDYVVRTDRMTFFLSKKDFREEDVRAIAAEVGSVMEDVRTYLGIPDAPGTGGGAECCLDSAYRDPNGQKRSWCDWEEGKLYCVSLTDFVHEYVHLVCETQEALVYHPGKFFSEGLAQSVSLRFHHGIATREYRFFRESPVSEDSDAEEHRTICGLLADNGFAYNAGNYNRAFAALLDRRWGIDKVDRNSDFYQYVVGPIFVDYCVGQLGGIEKFLSVYCDSVTVADVYGKTVEELVAEACAHNTAAFYRE